MYCSDVQCKCRSGRLEYPPRHPLLHATRITRGRTSSPSTRHDPSLGSFPPPQPLSSPDLRFFFKTLFFSDLGWSPMTSPGLMRSRMT